MKRFLIDDERVLPDIDKHAKCAAQAFNMLAADQDFDVYIFDHDLGSIEVGTTGYDVLKWALKEKLINEKASIYFTTNNPVGRKNMEDLLISYGWYNAYTHGFKYGG